MLSICIPTYAYDITLLVQILHKQALQAAIDFEICVIDDASPTYFQQKNQEITTLSSVSYQILPQNIGRSAIRNLLASQAKYPYLLFMDCDSMPETDNYIANYLTVINQAKIICGGRTYSPTSPHDDQYLRWKYGVEREC